MATAILPRHLNKEIDEALTSARVVNIVGPRQSGKTTLVRDLLGKGRFVTLDDEAVLTAIDADPVGQLQGLVAETGNAPLVIDEAQRSARLALAIKKLVDENRRMGQFVLTGSSNIFTSAGVADSLAGRVRTLKLLPLSAAEIHQQGPARLLDWAGRANPDLAHLPPPGVITRDVYIDLILRGGYPEIRDFDQRPRQRRYRDYLDAVIDRDVADVLKVRKTDALRRLVDQIAVRTGEELNIQQLTGIVGVRRSTLDQYLDVLTRLSIMARLGAWASGEARREIRNAKSHMLDTGLAAALRRLTDRSFAPDASPTALGGLVESSVYVELLKSIPYQAEDWRLYHWRGAGGREVDILAESDRRLVAFEVKASTTVVEADFKHLRWFASDGPGASWRVTAIVIYLGERPLSFGERLFALPLSSFWGFPPER